MKLLNEIQQKIKAPKTQKNTHGGYMYRSCSDILSAVKPYLSDGVAFLHMTDKLVQVGERNYVEATVTLTQGSEKITAIGYAREADDQKGMNAGQLSCSTSSYARKLALSGLFAIDDSHDAGNGANSAKSKTKKQLIAEAHTQYIKDNAKDIPEHFSVPLQTFQDAVMAEAKKQIPVAKRKDFAWTEESIKPFVLAVDITKILVEDK
jgi:hypothetical protein